jgi:ABC-type glycerol-3-phosphate transport system substrate-binding protein
MKRMVRVLIVAAVLLLGVTPLMARQAKPSGNINFAFWAQNATMEAGWQSLIDEFNKTNPDIHVKLVGATGTNWGEYLDSVATLIAGGEKIDLMWVATEGVQLLVKNLKIAVPLDDYMAKDKEALKEYLDDVNPQLLKAFQVDGKQYELPYGWNPMVIYYNTARLKEAGLEPPKANWTRDDFLKYAQALTVDSNKDGTPEKYGYAFDNSGMFVSAIPWIFANGGNIVTDDFCKPTVTDPKVEDAVQFMHDLIYKYKVSPAPTSGNTLFQSFQTGDVAMIGVGRWALVTLIPAKFTDFDIVGWPGNPNQLTEFGIDGFPILNTAQNPDAAWEFLKFMTGKAVQERLVGTADSPVGNVPSRKSVADEMSKFPPKNGMLLYNVINSPAKLVPSPPRFNQLENIFLRYTGSIFADEAKVADAMSAAQKELESVVKCG